MRRLLNVLAGLSVLLCVVAAALWIGGIRRMDSLAGSRHGYRWTIRLGAGEVSIERKTNPGGSDAPFVWSSHPLEAISRKGQFPSLVSESDSTLLGVSIRRRHERIDWLPANVNLDSTAVAIPYWLIVLLTLILPVSRLRFRKRIAPGLCPICRYNLRATPHRCPECGHVPARSAEKTGLTTENTEHTEEEQEARMEERG